MSGANGNGKVNGHVKGPKPQCPVWAIEAGIPLPEEGESFAEYVRRLGLNPAPMLQGLTERTSVLANARLSSKLADENPEVWNRHLERWVASVRRPTL